MKNITDVRNQLAEVFAELRAGAISPKVASELNNSAGKIINSLKVELEYYSLRKEQPDIEFFEKKEKIKSKT